MEGNDESYCEDQVAYYALGTSRHTYRYNHPYSAYITPRYRWNLNQPVHDYNNHYQDYLLYTYAVSCLRYLYTLIMWLIRKLIRVRVCQHVIASCLLILTFILLSYVLEEDEAKNRIENVHVQLDKINRRPVTNKVVPVYDLGAKCDNMYPCLTTQYAYNVRTGLKSAEKPYICIAGKEIMTADDMTRGLNIVLIQDITHMQKITTQSFDLYQEDSSQLEAFLNHVKDGEVIVAVTFDDAANRLSTQARNYFKDHFHSKHIGQLNYRGQWAFIGQKGSALEGEHEQVNPFVPAPGVEWGEQLKIQGCFAVKGQPQFKPVKTVVSSCDVPPDCESDSIPMHIESGDYHAGRKTLPRICIDGVLVLGNHRIGKEDPATRGLNFVIYNPVDKEVVKIGRFDTYESAHQDSEVASFLQSVEDGHLVIGTTYDEATRKLSFETKDVLRKIGSTQIYGLEFRAMWVFVGQKGIKGSSPYEKIGQKQDSWGSKVDIMECIPKQISGVDGEIAVDKRRQKFCDDYIGYAELCSDENIGKPIYPLPLDDPSLQTNLAYSAPIVVIPGTDLYALERCLSSLIAVPGIRTSNVAVILEGSFSEPNDLVSLYGFRAEYIKSSRNYQQTLLKGIERSLSAFQGKEYIIVLEDYVSVNSDFLHYFSQTMHLLEKDDTIMTVSAWNPNGFEDTSGDPHLLYRTEDFPGFGWVLKRKLYNNEIMNKNSGCCGQPTWQGWFLNEELRHGRHTIIPDLSRVKRIKKDGFYEEKSYMDTYLAKRKSSSGFLGEPRNVYKLVSSEYDKEIERLIDESIAVKEYELASCLEYGVLQLQHDKDAGSVYLVFYYQTEMHDQSVLRQLCQCFGLFVYKDTAIQGLNKGLLRFTRNGNQYMLVGILSVYNEYYRAKGKLPPVIGNPAHPIVRR